MPDWKKAKHYEFSEATTRERWCWEFLRRNAKYQADYEKSKSGEVMYDPPRMPGESKVAWSLRGSGEGREPYSAVAAVFLGRKWRINGAICDPKTRQAPEFAVEYPQNHVFYESIGEHFEPSESANGDVIIKDGFAAVIFKLDSSIERQLRDAKLQLRASQSQIIGAKTKIWKRYPLFVRLLDAASAGAAHKEIATVLLNYKHYGNSAADGYAASKRVSNDLKAARRLRDNPLLLLE